MNDISPIRVGQTDPPCRWLFKDALGNIIPFPSLTTFTQYIYNNGTGQTAIGAGSFTVVDLSGGRVDYAWNTSDVQIAGNYLVYAGYVLPTGGAGFTDTVELTINPITTTPQ